MHKLQLSFTLAVARGGDQSDLSFSVPRTIQGKCSLRVPGRLNITWADDNTLKVDMDSGTQTRFLHFNPTHFHQSTHCVSTILQPHSKATFFHT